MGQKKLFRFEAILSFPNVFQYTGTVPGDWKNFFNNEHPLTLELACGKGEYTVALAKRHPERNFIGVDLKGNRLYVGAKKCLQDGIRNAAFLRAQIGMIDSYFQRGAVDEIWITFPDPQLRQSKAKKRLTHPIFLRLYQKILRPGGFVHLKTDSPALYAFTKTVIRMYGLILYEEQDNVYENGSAGSELFIKTYYESLDIAGSNRIHYLRFSLPSSALPDLDADLHETLKGYEETTG